MFVADCYFELGLNVLHLMVEPRLCLLSGGTFMSRISERRRICECVSTYGLIRREGKMQSVHYLVSS